MDSQARFADLNPLGRGIIACVAAITLGITLVAFAVSYNALYRLIEQLGLYGQRTNQVYPLLLDAAFIGGELAGILAASLRALSGSREVHRGWPATAVVVCGTLTVTFNVVHAGLLADDRLRLWRCLAAALPPALMMISFQIDVAIVRWVMATLGRSLTTTGGPVAGGLVALQPAAQTTVQRPEAVAPGEWPGYGAGTFPPQGPYGEMPSTSAQRAGQNGHDRGWKGEQTREYLATLDAGELASMSRAKLRADMRVLGVPIDETYAGNILGKYRANGAGKEAHR